jgi:hypothetical protein
MKVATTYYQTALQEGPRYAQPEMGDYTPMTMLTLTSVELMRGTNSLVMKPGELAGGSSRFPGYTNGHFNYLKQIARTSSSISMAHEILLEVASGGDHPPFPDIGLAVSHEQNGLHIDCFHGNGGERGEAPPFAGSHGGPDNGHRGVR